MSLENTPFQTTRLEEDRERDKGKVFTVRFSEEEYAELQKNKKILCQVKDSTALKQLASLGANVLHSQLLGGVINDLFKNKSNNKRHNIVNFD